MSITTKELAKKYNISETRLYHIIRTKAMLDYADEIRKQAEAKAIDGLSGQIGELAKDQEALDTSRQLRIRAGEDALDFLLEVMNTKDNDMKTRLAAAEKVARLAKATGAAADVYIGKEDLYSLRTALAECEEAQGLKLEDLGHCDDPERDDNDVVEQVFVENEPDDVSAHLDATVGQEEVFPVCEVSERSASEAPDVRDGIRGVLEEE
jgi:hypothetical protein